MAPWCGQARQVGRVVHRAAEVELDRALGETRVVVRVHEVARLNQLLDALQCEKARSVTTTRCEPAASALIVSTPRLGGQSISTTSKPSQDASWRLSTNYPRWRAATRARRAPSPTARAQTPNRFRRSRRAARSGRARASRPPSSTPRRPAPRGLWSPRAGRRGRRAARDLAAASCAATPSATVVFPTPPFRLANTYTFIARLRSCMHANEPACMKSTATRKSAPRSSRPLPGAGAPRDLVDAAPNVGRTNQPPGRTHGSSLTASNLALQWLDAGDRRSRVVRTTANSFSVRVHAATTGGATRAADDAGKPHQPKVGSDFDRYGLLRRLHERSPTRTRRTGSMCAAASKNRVRLVEIRCGCGAGAPECAAELLLTDHDESRRSLSWQEDRVVARDDRRGPGCVSLLHSRHGGPPCPRRLHASDSAYAAAEARSGGRRSSGAVRGRCARPRGDLAHRLRRQRERQLGDPDRHHDQRGPHGNLGRRRDPSRSRSRPTPRRRTSPTRAPTRSA